MRLPGSEVQNVTMARYGEASMVNRMARTTASITPAAAGRKWNQASACPGPIGASPATPTSWPPARNAQLGPICQVSRIKPHCDLVAPTASARSAMSSKVAGAICKSRFFTRFLVTT